MRKRDKGKNTKIGKQEIKEGEREAEKNKEGGRESEVKFEIEEEEEEKSAREKKEKNLQYERAELICMCS